MSKTQKVLNHLIDVGHITSWEAINKYQATRLSAIVFNLKKHHDIETVLVQRTEEDGSVTRYANYIYKGAKNGN